ncbi:MAG TPA: radical SAM protein [Burkholderiaceae bacterium]|nr:radical SAM protein [Burkholderiaceae bacterium]
MELPDFIQIEPVGQCNLRCRMCPIQFRTDGRRGEPPAFMSYADFCSVIDQFPSLTELHLQGLGEPLLHLYFFNMVRYAAERGIRVSTNTNLTILSESRAEECVRSGLQVMHVSMDGASPVVYEAIRERARFDKVLRNLRRVMRARDSLHSALPQVRLVCVVMRSNLHDLPSLVRLAHDEGVDTLSVQHLCHDFSESSLPAHYRPMRAFIDEQTLLNDDPERVAQFFGAARSTAQELGVSLRLPNVRPHLHPHDASGRSRCDWPWRGAYVSYDGKAMPCCMVATPDRANFGDMVRDDAATIWNGNEYSNFRARLISDEPPEICRGCAVYSGTF